jgi:hypothetical protein
MRNRAMVATGMTLWLCALMPAAGAAEEKPQASPATATPAKEAKPGVEAKSVKPAGPRLEMGKDHPRNPGKERDMRHCLDLPDEKQVIRCYEKK